VNVEQTLEATKKMEMIALNLRKTKTIKNGKNLNSNIIFKGEKNTMDDAQIREMVLIVVKYLNKNFPR